jgi:hypothetical protein
MKSGFDDVKKSFKLALATNITALLLIGAAILGVVARLKWI